MARQPKTNVKGGREGKGGGRKGRRQYPKHNEHSDVSMSACQPSGKDKGLSEGTEKECVGFKTQRACPSTPQQVAHRVTC